MDRREDPGQYYPGGSAVVTPEKTVPIVGGAVQSVNGQSGDVVLTGADLTENPGSEKTLSQAVAENYAKANGADAKINAHMANTKNPHNVSAEQIGALPAEDMDGSKSVSDRVIFQNAVDVAEELTVGGHKVALTSEVPYSLNADNIKDRAVNNIGLSDAGPYTLTPPQQVPGSVRDFVVRIKTGSVAPTIDWSAFGSCEVRDGDSWEDMMVCEANKDYIYRFTDMVGLTLFAEREEVSND